LAGTAQVVLNGRMALDHFPDYVQAQLLAISDADLDALVAERPSLAAAAGRAGGTS
jgi:hypothetical protein